MTIYPVHNNSRRYLKATETKDRKMKNELSLRNASIVAVAAAGTMLLVSILSISSVPGTSPALGEGSFWFGYGSVETQANVFTGSKQENATVAALPGGGFVMAWDSRRQERGSYGVYARLFDSFGRPAGPEVHVNTHIPGMQRRPAAAAGADGKIWIAWESFGQDGSSASVVARCFDATLNPRTEEIAVNVSREGAQYEPVLAVNHKGTALLAWTSDRFASGRSNPAVYARLLSDSGSARSPEIRLSPVHEHRDKNPSTTALPDGSFAVAWARVDGSGNPTGIFARAVSENGVMSPETNACAQGAAYPAGSVSPIEPSLTADDQGRIFITWLAAEEDGYGVYLRRFDSSLLPAGEVQHIAAPSDGWKSGAAAASAPDGRLAIAFNSDGTDGSGDGIVVRLFDESGEPAGFPAVVNRHRRGRQALSIASGAQRIVWSENDCLAFAWNGDSGHGDKSAVNLTLRYPSNAGTPPPIADRFNIPAAEVASEDFLAAKPPIWDPDYQPAEPLAVVDGKGPDFGFEAVPGTGWVPPDPELAVGYDRLVVIVNGQIAAFTKTGTNLFRDEIENSFGFWGELGADNFVFDPECCWDPHSERFWAMACERSDDNKSKFLLAVSKDSSPNDRNDWHKWRIDVTSIAGNDIDSPNMAVDADCVYLTADFFGPDKYLIYILEKDPLLGGGSGATTYELITGTSQQSMGIPVTYDADAPAQYIIQSTEYSSNNTVIFHAIQNPFTAYDRQTVTVNVETYTYPNQPPQKGSSSRPYLFEPRFWSCLQRDGHMWATHHVNSSRARMRWYQFDMNGWPDSDIPPEVLQHGEIDPGSGIHTFFGSIHADSQGNAALTFARSSSSEYISMSRAIRLAGDPPGTFREPVFVKESTSAHTSGRWGDYSFTQTDPAADPGTFWGHHEFCTSGGWSWRTWVAQYLAEGGMTLEADPLIAGEYCELTATGADPFEQVYFIYSLAGIGSTYIPQLNVTLGLDEPHLIGSATADASGTAVYGAVVKPAAQGRTVWLQAAHQSKTSNVTEEAVQ